MIKIWLKIVILIEILHLYIYIGSKNGLKLSSFIQLSLGATGDPYNKNDKNPNYDSQQDSKSDILKLDNPPIILKQKSKSTTDIPNQNFSASNQNLNIDSGIMSEEEMDEDNIIMNHRSRVKECSYLFIEEIMNKLIKLKIEITVIKIQIQLHLDKTRFCHGKHRLFSITSIKCIGSRKKVNELSQKLVNLIRKYREEMKIYLDCIEYNSREQSSKTIGYRIHSDVKMLECTAEELNSIRTRKVLQKGKYLILSRSVLSISRELENCHKCGNHRNNNLCKKCILMSNCKEHISNKAESFKDEVKELRNKEYSCESFLALKQSAGSSYKDENSQTKEKISNILKKKSAKLRDSEDDNTGEVNSHKKSGIKESVNEIESNVSEDILFQSEGSNILKGNSASSRDYSPVKFNNNKQTDKIAPSIQTEVKSDSSNQSKKINVALNELSKTSIDDNIEEDINKPSTKSQYILPTLDLKYKGKSVEFGGVRRKDTETGSCKLIKKKPAQPEEQKTKISSKSLLEHIEPRTQEAEIITKDSLKLVEPQNQQTKVIFSKKGLSIPLHLEPKAQEAEIITKDSLKLVEPQNQQTKVIFSKKGLNVPLHPKSDCTLFELEKLIQQRNKLIEEGKRLPEKVQKELLDMKIKEIESCMLQRTSN